MHVRFKRDTASHERQDCRHCQQPAQRPHAAFAGNATISAPGGTGTAASASPFFRPRFLASLAPCRAEVQRWRGQTIGWFRAQASTSLPDASVSRIRGRTPPSALRNPLLLLRCFAPAWVPPRDSRRPALRGGEVELRPAPGAPGYLGRKAFAGATLLHF
jgi:hypothetical protein